jgi:hypothetical protein
MREKTSAQAACASLDAARTPGTALRWWGLPILVIIGATVGDWLAPWLLTVWGLTWSFSIFWLSVSCLRNAKRCGRFHCAVLGIGYPLLGLLALGMSLGLVRLAWNSFWFLIFAPLTLAAFLPELFGVKYIGRKARSA